MPYLRSLTDSQRELLRAKFDEGMTPRPSNPDNCWLWGKGTTTFGYGRIGMFKDYWTTHRLSFEFFNGDIPDGLCVLHKCDNPLCNNPSHLFTGTNADNVADMVFKNRQSKLKGERNGNSKLRLKDVGVIRRMARAGVAFSDIGYAFDITPTMSRHVATGKNWPHVNDIYPPLEL